MKKNLHPTYKKDVPVNCICGENFTVNSTVEGPIKIESCPSCHPTYTGKQETQVVKGRMEKFYEKQKKIDSLKNNKE